MDEPEVIGEKSPNFREITPDWFFGGPKRELIEVTLLTTTISAIEHITNRKKTIEHVAETKIKLTPKVSKSLVIWLLDNIKRYETINGKIESVEEKDDSNAERQKISRMVDDLLARI